jgi:hypothetical protein
VKKGWLILAGLAAFGGCGQSEPSPPASIAQAVHPGAELKRSDGDLHVIDTLEKRGSDDDYISEAAFDIKRIAQALQAGAPDLPPGTQTISVLFLRPDLDRLGNSTAHSFFDVTFSVADLKAAHVDRLGAFGAVDLAQEAQVVLPWNVAFGQWCSAHDRAPHFCEIARASVAPEYQWPVAP